MGRGKRGWTRIYTDFLAFLRVFRVLRDPRPIWFFVR